MISILSDYYLENLWRKLEDVTFSEDEDGKLVLASDWLAFKAGTDRDTIWRWFDQAHSKGVGWLVENIEI